MAWHGPFQEEKAPFPGVVAVRFQALHDGDPALARLPAELGNAVPSRRSAFLAGRLCAAEALRRAGAPTYDVAYGPGGTPGWPPGWAGSITHASPSAGASGFAAAVACPAGARGPGGAGLDSEWWIGPARAERIARRIAAESELLLVERALGCSPPRALTLVFSAKEALYKRLAPACGRFFGFSDAELVAVSGSGAGGAEGRFRLRLLADLRTPGRPESAGLAPGLELEGSFKAEPELLHALV